MTPNTLLILVSLAERVVAAAGAMAAVRDKIRTAQDEGRELTLDDLKELELEDDAARDELLRAIEENE